MYRKLISLILVVTFFSVVVYSRDPIYLCAGRENKHPIWTEQPVYQAQVPNVFGEEAIQEMLGKITHILPKTIVEIIDKFGLHVALDFVADENKQYVPAEFFEELQGLADGSGVDYKDLLRVHMFPELVRASCSIVGVWGENTNDARLLQLRALDWGLQSPLNSFPAYIVYHPNQGNGNPYAILGWSGFLGALTGYSQYVGVSEKVWLAYNGTYTYRGTPFYLVMKQILQYDSTIDEAINRVYNAKRTCAIFMGIGSNSTNTAVILEYSLDRVNIFSDTVKFPGFAQTPVEHPLIPQMVYVDKHRQPSNDPCMASYLIQASNMTAQSIIQLCAYQQTGDLHIAVYDYQANQVYISVASTNFEFPYKSGQVSPSFANQFIQLDMNTQFSLQVNRDY
ncbi:hypothetical protein PPL_04454 [Heterostelium album PN500]|uniref:Acid ceramidase-like protein n=1 Tax=Heterostelium pallidum (strain ATCC 26659 / Pp 5 / PN500) TaxID=670386 RepID=D3B7L6_HETP5|nr:hypothetical protein PPL_04454 [Heterostelium album PN500]EFA82759.1 hypothetical protein PPL_04454 [Heterostelium album PN500]|eukprot:XP_020434876.1 hypothetical protein PPL_04454 [Heterostelium album PN500]